MKGARGKTDVYKRQVFALSAVLRRKEYDYG